MAKGPLCPKLVRGTDPRNKFSWFDAQHKPITVSLTAKIYLLPGRLGCVCVSTYAAGSILVLSILWWYVFCNL